MQNIQKLRTTANYGRRLKDIVIYQLLPDGVVLNREDNYEKDSSYYQAL